MPVPPGETGAPEINANPLVWSTVALTRLRVVSTPVAYTMRSLAGIDPVMVCGYVSGIAVLTQVAPL